MVVVVGEASTDRGVGKQDTLFDEPRDGRPESLVWEEADHTTLSLAVLPAHACSQVYDGADKGHDEDDGPDGKALFLGRRTCTTASASSTLAGVGVLPLELVLAGKVPVVRQLEIPHLPRIALDVHLDIVPVRRTRRRVLDPLLDNRDPRLGRAGQRLNLEIKPANRLLLSRLGPPRLACRDPRRVAV